MPWPWDKDWLFGNREEKAAPAEPPPIDPIRNKLESLLNAGVTSRKSPIGLDEYIVPENLLKKDSGFPWPFEQGAQAVTQRAPKPYTVYREKFSAAPEVMAHERIHAGQLMLPNEPTARQISKVFNVSEAEAQDPGTVEYPAYAFDEPKFQKKNQPDFNKYIDLMYQLNPGQSQPLEISMPDAFIREYVKSHPRPLLKKKMTIPPED